MDSLTQNLKAKDTPVSELPGSLKEDLNNKECSVCPRECGAKRYQGQKGYCGVDSDIRIARAALHMWEEPCISGDRGSGTVFFSGCPLHCVYCQNYEISGGQGRIVSAEALAGIFIRLQDSGAHNINLVTPTHYSPQIKKSLILSRERGLSIPIVYNCGGYEKVETLKELDGLIDIYLTDYKYPDEKGASLYSNAPDYPKAALKAIEEMIRQKPEPRINDSGLMESGVIVRHLVLPGRVRPAREAIRVLYDKFGTSIFFSIMNQYTPLEEISSCKSKYPELNRKVTKREYERVLSYALDLGIERAYFQEGDTAKESFIPPFDY